MGGIQSEEGVGVKTERNPSTRKVVGFMRWN
jgi:hypothetical protein